MSAPFLLPRIISNLIRKKVSKCGANVAPIAMFGMAQDKVFRELGTEQARQILSTVSTIDMHCILDRRAGDVINDVFVNNEFSLAYITIGSYLQLVMLDGTKRAPVGLLRIMATMNVLKVLFYIYDLCFLRLTRKKEHLRGKVSFKAGICAAVATRADIAIYKTFLLVVNPCSLISCELPYLFFYPSRRQFLCTC